MRRILISRGAIERIAENRILQAMEEGLFDNLPGLGKPIPDLDGSYDPDWWVKKWIRRENLQELGRLLAEVRRPAGRQRSPGSDQPPAALRVQASVEPETE